MAKQIRVKAIRLGFRRGRRVRVGTEFWVNENELYRRDRETGEVLKDKRGEPIKVSWYVPIKPKVEEFEREVPTGKSTKDDSPPEPPVDPVRSAAEEQFDLV